MDGFKSPIHLNCMVFFNNRIVMTVRGNPEDQEETHANTVSCKLHTEMTWATHRGRMKEEKACLYKEEEYLDQGKEK